MKRNRYFISGAVLAAAWLSAGLALAQSSGQSQRKTIHPDPNASVGGSKSERAGESGTPMGKDSPYSGTVEMGRGGRAAHAAGDVKATQEALKDKGYDPGPIDGVMGARTKEALKKFQHASGIAETGTLDKETANKLGVDRGNARGSSDSTSGRSSTSGSSNSTSRGGNMGKSSTSSSPTNPTGTSD